MKIVLVGGHHTGALPIISELRKRDPSIEMFWIGHKNHTLEYKEIKELGIKFYNLHAGKIYRTINPIRLLKVPVGFFQALGILLKLKPNVILSFGGYIAAPVVLAGWFLRIPSLTHEQTVVAGYANRFISKFVNKILVSWKESEKYFPIKKTKYVGLPLRESIFNSSSNNFKTNLELPTVYITGGKTGAHKINDAVLGNIEALLNICNVIHQCGDSSVYRDYEKLKEKYESIKTAGRYHLRKFIFADEIGEVFKKANLVVGRSGAHMISELLALEKPAVLIPIPWVSHNEQRENAKILYKVGLGRILEEKDLNPTTLVNTIKMAIVSLHKMKVRDSTKIKTLKNSRELIVDAVFKTSKSKN